MPVDVYLLVAYLDVFYRPGGPEPPDMFSSCPYVSEMLSARQLCLVGLWMVGCLAVACLTAVKCPVAGDLPACLVGQLPGCC